MFKVCYRGKMSIIGVFFWIMKQINKCKCVVRGLTANTPLQTVQISLIYDYLHMESLRRKCTIATRKFMSHFRCFWCKCLDSKITVIAIQNF